MTWTYLLFTFVLLAFSLTGSGLFAVPPGVKQGGFIGDVLFA